ncbi:MAG: glycosyltransferase [Candidatus Heimdallarchaeota archaeon]|nr:MAG: glycosyltransferase [Candidatus Heimdallarchaeota archaeon]
MVTNKEDFLKVFFGFYDVFPARKGSSIRTRHLFSKLSDTNVTIFCKQKTGQLSYEIDNPFEIFRVPCVSPPPFKQSAEFSLKLKEFLQERVQEIDYNLWHCRSPFDGYIIAQEAEKRDEPMIFEANGLPSIEWPYHYPKIIKKHRKALRRLTAMELLTALTATHVIVVSHVTKDYLVSCGISQKKISIIPNGASHKFTPNRLPPASRAQLLSLPNRWEDRILIGYIGAFQSWQGIHTLIESLSTLTVRGKESFGLVLIGKAKSSWRHFLRKIAKKHGVRELIHFCSPRSFSLMPQIVNCFDIAVSPLAKTPRNTIQGCNPIKLYEYAASGVPIVVSDLPVTREILTDDSCRFIPPDSPVALGEALKDLIQNPEERDKLAKNVRKAFISEDNSWSKRADRLQSLYSSLLSK